MGDNCSTQRRTPQKMIRETIELCADCDTCRFLMAEDCMFFPELYRLWDLEKGGGAPIKAAELRKLVDLCTLCGLCPCPRIPADLIEAKSRYIEHEGLPLAARLLADVPRMSRLCGTLPRLVNALQANRVAGPLFRKLMNIHPERKLPLFPEQDFFKWAEQQGITVRKTGEKNVAYFAGCTAGYLFPRVGHALVEVLERNGIRVYVPPQHCCGMPHMVEGDRKKTLKSLRLNMDHLLAAVKAGDDLICSCPSCGFFMKVLLKERACYSEAFQRAANAGEHEIRVPVPGHGGNRMKVLRKSMYKGILKDDGYFSDLDPLARIKLADQFADAGEYLAKLLAAGKLDTSFIPIPRRMVYFAPCHQREQKIGSPYADILALIPGLTVEAVGGVDCCGMGGNFGFKTGFHDTSLAVGRSLMAKIREREPEEIITDCMSCRLQFQHALPIPVHHPLEILARAYGTG